MKLHHYFCHLYGPLIKGKSEIVSRLCMPKDGKGGPDDDERREEQFLPIRNFA